MKMLVQLPSYVWSSSFQEFVDKEIQQCIVGCNAYSYRKCNFVQNSSLIFKKFHNLLLKTLKHSISAFCLDVGYVRGHCGATLEPGVYSDKQPMNISSSESSSVHPGAKFGQ